MMVGTPWCNLLAERQIPVQFSSATLGPKPHPHPSVLLLPLLTVRHVHRAGAQRPAGGLNEGQYRMSDGQGYC